jgi:hypothetical protein
VLFLWVFIAQRFDKVIKITFGMFLGEKTLMNGVIKKRELRGQRDFGSGAEV